MSTTVANYICKQLIKRNIKYAFGYSGGANLPLLDAFYSNKQIQFIKNSTEQCSGFVAEGFSKSLYLAQPGIIVTTSGPGLTNIITPLQNAYSDGTPMIAISAQVPTHAIGTDAFQECPAVKLTKHCTKWNIQIKNKDEIISALDTAFNISMSPRKGPVHIDIPKDILLQTIDLTNEEKKNKFYHVTEINGGNIYNKIDTFVKLLNKSKKPIIIAGQGCNNGYKGLREFAIKHNIPVTTTIHGVGSFDENHKLSLEMLGMHGNPVANYGVQEADMIIAIGTRFDDRITGNLKEFGLNAIDAGSNSRGGIYHIDSSLNQINKVRKLFSKYYDNIDSFTKFIECDSYTFFNFCNNRNIITKKNNWINNLFDYKSKNKYYYNENNKLKAPDVIKCINQTIDELKINRDNLYFTTGVGNHQMWTSQHIKWTTPNKMITSGSLGTMGVGVPFAIGSKLANPYSMVICIDGDSSFCMTSNELQTILENNINIKIAIMNDSRQQMVHVWQKLFHNSRYIATDNINPDFKKLGESYNIMSIDCSNKTKLKETVKDFLEYDEAIIGVFNIDPEMCYPLVAPGKSLDDMILNENDLIKLNKDTNAPN